MAFGSVTLVPGVNSERTPTLLRAGIASSNNIRFRDDLVQKWGGWVIYYPFNLGGVPRDLHAWQDLNGIGHLLVGTTTELDIITGNTRQNITPQTLVSNFAPNISTTASSNVVTIVDPNISGITVEDSVFFNVPISVGGIILDGLYQIMQINSPTSYNIEAATNATATVSNPTATNNTTAAGNATLHFGTTPSWLVDGVAIFDLTTPASIPSATVVSGTSGTTVTMSKNAAGAGVGNGDNIIFAGVPMFTTVSGSAAVEVTFPAHGLSAGNEVSFVIPTTANGVTISGLYTVASVPDANNFNIAASTQATANGVFAMNLTGFVQLVYYIALGPAATGVGYGVGASGYGSGGYGTGVVPASQQGNPITATDWTSDNWGQIAVMNPMGGGLYYYDPTGGFTNASLISSAPPFNNGMFISIAEQIMIAYGSSVHQNVGWQKQPNLVQWCDVGNFFQWAAAASNQAGNFTIPTGSMLVGGMAVANQNLLWTDLDLWAMPYIGPPDVFGFNKIGAGMGLASSHAAQQFRGSVYWMGKTNFYSYTSNGSSVIPCPVWDAVFQNINTNFIQNVRAMPNTPFNEIGWLYPSAASSNGENDSWVRMNVTEEGAPWDYGQLGRSAWIDQSVLGMPIGTNQGGLILQHETGYDGRGNPITATFTTGEFYLAEGETYVFVDQIIPDFKYGTFSGSQTAQIQMTFHVSNFPGDTPVSYGPYTVTASTEYISVRFRGRMMSITISSSDLGSFWRIGSIKYRYAPAGRR